MKIEQWKFIPGFEGLYMVSNLGRVKSLDHYVEHINGSRRLIKGRILKPQNNKSGKGYLLIWLSKDGKLSRHYIHRLVAMAFIPNPDGLPCVNHKDENPSNNDVENLEWCTVKYNSNYGTSKARISNSKLGKRNTKNSKPVSQFTLDGKHIKDYPSIQEVERQNGFWHGNVSGCCLGRHKSAYGYIWRYTE